MPAPVSSEVHVALAPSATYRRLLDEPGPAAWWRMLARPALALLVIAVVVPAMAIQRVTFGLAATAAVSWSFVIAIQMLAGAAVIASAPGRRTGMARALDLWFAGQLPYSLWLLVAAVVLANMTTVRTELSVLTAVIPAAWTAVIVAAFCRTVLGTTARGARWRAAAHQAASWGIAVLYFAWAAGGFFRLRG